VLRKKETKEVVELKNFRSKFYEIFHQDEIGEALRSASADLINDIETFLENGSQWKFKKNKKLHVNVFHYKPIKGSSYIPLPPIIANKKACVNIKNNDAKCFLYSVIAHVHPQPNHQERVAPLMKYVDEYKEWKKEFPMRIKDVGKFEKQFGNFINIYSYEIKGAKVKSAH